MPVLRQHDSVRHPHDAPAIVEGETIGAAKRNPVGIDVGRSDRREHGDQAGRGEAAGPPLDMAQIRATLGSDLAIRPRLFGGPLNGVETILGLGPEWLPLPFALVTSARVLNEDGISILGKLHHRLVHAVTLHTIGCPDDQHRVLALGPGTVEVPIELDTIAHGHGQMALQSDR
ncbi:MAG: hypothetical protein RIR86_979 [Acidobacteriota bacterium]